MTVSSVHRCNTESPDILKLEVLRIPLRVGLLTGYSCLACHHMHGGEWDKETSIEDGMGGAEEAGAGACADQEDKGAEHHASRVFVASGA